MSRDEAVAEFVHLVTEMQQLLLVERAAFEDRCELRCRCYDCTKTRKIDKLMAQVAQWAVAVKSEDNKEVPR